MDNYREGQALPQFISVFFSAFWTIGTHGFFDFSPCFSCLIFSIFSIFWLSAWGWRLREELRELGGHHPYIFTGMRSIRRSSLWSHLCCHLCCCLCCHLELIISQACEIINEHVGIWHESLIWIYQEDNVISVDFLVGTGQLEEEKWTVFQYHLNTCDYLGEQCYWILCMEWCWKRAATKLPMKSTNLSHLYREKSGAFINSWSQKIESVLVQWEGIGICYPPSTSSALWSKGLLFLDFSVVLLQA